MLLSDVVAASGDVAATSSRLAKRDRLAELLGAAGPQEIGVVVSWLSGALPQRQVGVGHAALRRLPAPATSSTLDVATVDATFSAIKATTGAGSVGARGSQVQSLFGHATGDEQRFLSRLLRGDLGQGALIGVMTDAIARTFDVPPAEVRRAAMLGGALPAVAEAVARDGRDALADFTLEVLRPVGPMLAQTASSVEDALERLGGSCVFEAKLDGARVQIHRLGEEVRVYTRTLDDVTERLPEVIAATRALPVVSFVADGEAIALRPDGRPHSFQDTASRFGRRVDLDAAVAAQPLSVFFFDVLHLDGADLMDAPYRERAEALARVVPASQRVGRLVTSSVAKAEAFLAATLAAGHEGVMAKSLDAPYEAGRRGAGWLKVKPVHTVDLVVLAVEWGSGRRTGKLSNLHLGARDPATGEHVMLGKTFKGMTDEMLSWQTEHFLSIADGSADGNVVRVRHEQVVEIAIDGVQRSTRYPGGIALRFARVLRYRDDKPVDEIDTVDAVRALGATDPPGQASVPVMARSAHDGSRGTRD